VVGAAIDAVGGPDEPPPAPPADPTTAPPKQP
jgi:hypothetical protein